MGSHYRNCIIRLGFLTLTAKGVSGRCAADLLPGAAGELVECHWPRKEATIAAAWLRPPEPDRPDFLFAVSLALARLGLLSTLINSERRVRARPQHWLLSRLRSQPFIPLRRTPVSPAKTARAGRALLIGPAAGMAVFCVGCLCLQHRRHYQPHIIRPQGMRSGDVIWAFPCKEATLIPSLAVLYVRRALVERARGRKPFYGEQQRPTTGADAF